VSSMLPSLPFSLDDVREARAAVNAGVVGGLAQTADRYALWSELLLRFGVRYPIDPVQITQVPIDPYLELSASDAHQLFPAAVPPDDARVEARDQLLDSPDHRPLWLPRNLRVEGPDPALVREDFSFRSPHRGRTREFQAQLEALSENATVHGRMYRVRGATPRRAIVIAHGFMAGSLDAIGVLARSEFMAPRDLAVVAIELPHHVKRTAPGRFSGELFMSGDVVRTFEAILQAVADLRATVRWLREGRGIEWVGLVGGSLGGYLSTLTATFEKDLDLLFAIAPPIRLTDNIGKVPLGRYMESGLRAQAIPDDVLARLQDLVDPARYRPALSTSRMRFIAGRNDLFVPVGHMEGLARHWPGIEIDWHGWGHMTAFMAWPPSRLFPEIARLIDASADAPPV